MSSLAGTDAKASPPKAPPLPKSSKPHDTSHYHHPQGKHMKLVRFGSSGAEKPGLIDAQGVLRDLSGTVHDIDSALLAQDGLKKLSALKPEDLPEVRGEPRIGPCVGKVGKIVCVGLNYSDHAK